MKICEHCGGLGSTGRAAWLTQPGEMPPKILCGVCHGTGVIPLGPEGRDRYLAKRREALDTAIKKGSVWNVGTERDPRWVPVTPADLDEFDRWKKEADIEWKRANPDFE